MKVSVIIPVYNVENYVADCIRSVLRQTYSNIEVVIVDDCTKDNSMEVVADVLDSEKTTFGVEIVRHETNGGLSAARNTGIRRSTGDFLYFLDSDDEITPDCIEKLVTRQQENGADIVVGGYDIVNARKDFIYPVLSTRSSIINKRKDVIREYMRGNIYVMAWNKLIRRKFLYDNGLYFKEGLVHEDDLWSFRCACCADRVGVVKDKTYIYKIRSGSIMDYVRFEKEVEWRTIILKEMLECVAEKGLGSNRHVFSRLQEEKLSILYQCRKYNYRDVAKEWYSGLDVRVAGLWRILGWYFFNTRKMIRDAHYFLGVPDNEEYYWNMPDYMWNTARKKRYFYPWFVKVLIYRSMRIKRNSGLPFA